MGNGQEKQKESALFKLNWTEILLASVGFLVASLVGVLLYIWNDEVESRNQFQDRIEASVDVVASRSNANDIYIDVIADFIHEKYGVNIQEQVWQRMYIETLKNNAPVMQSQSSRLRIDTNIHIRQPELKVKEYKPPPQISNSYLTQLLMFCP